MRMNTSYICMLASCHRVILSNSNVIPLCIWSFISMLYIAVIFFSVENGLAVCWVRTSTWIDVPVLVWYSHMLHVLIPVPKAKSRYLDGWTWTKCLKNTGNLYTGIRAKKFLLYSSDQWKRKGCRSRFWDGDWGVLQSFEVEMRKYQHPWRGQTHLSYVNQHCDFGTALELFESLIFGSGKFTCGNELDALSERGLGKFERDGIVNKITENRKGWQRGGFDREEM